MGEVVGFSPPKSAVEVEVDRLLSAAEEGGALTCVIQNSAGDITLAFEPWPATIGMAGLSAANEIMDRFRESKEFRDALIAYSWNVGACFVADHLREVAAN